MADPLGVGLSRRSHVAGIQRLVAPTAALRRERSPGVEDAVDGLGDAVADPVDVALEALLVAAPVQFQHDPVLVQGRLPGAQSRLGVQRRDGALAGLVGTL